MSEELHLQSELCHAANEGDLLRMKAAIREGADLNSVYDEWPPLHWAIYGGRYFAARFLLRLGADVEVQDAAGRTPLMSAIDEGCAWTEGFGADLLVRGANPNRLDENGDSAIQLASYRNLHSVVQLLLENGADDKTGTPCWEEKTMDSYDDDMSDVNAIMRQNALINKSK